MGKEVSVLPYPLRAIRQHLNFSQMDLEEESDVSRRVISLIENSLIVPSSLMRKKLSDALGVSEDKIYWPQEMLEEETFEQADLDVPVV